MHRDSPFQPWQRAAALRRTLLLLLILVTILVASSYMANLLPHRGTTHLELVIVIVFGILFGWISIGFWESVAGLFILARRIDRFAMTAPGEEGATLEATDARTAILLPIANENVDRFFAGLQVTFESLKETGQLAHFDFFILSDSSDPDKWVEEEAAWVDLCRTLDGFDRIFYRHRKVNLKRKSGNIADFCRRWGKNYRYMVVFDADSVMTGPTLVQMVLIMEQHPRVGILQSSPLAVNRETPIARCQQFANHVYGPMFTGGLHFMQLGDSHFWGHNAIIRIAPFMKHCGLPQLSGKPPRGGYIMSHDFVEAAFMRRGGWEVWLAYHLTGSYEEVPPSLLDELKRDRRWCQGNIQHLRLLFTRGVRSAHRALFLHGVMSYGSALFWFLFITLSTIEAVLEAFYEPVYFPAGRALFPDWPVWHPKWALTLLATTAVLLFMPKLFSVLLVLIRRSQATLFGGTRRLLTSMVLEVVLSSLLAPIRMLSHSKFIFLALLGRQVGWGPQKRDDQGTSWGEAFRFHGLGMLLGVIWASVLFLYNRSFFWWNAPIFIPLLLSIPISVWSSRAGIGLILRKMGLFLIPEEVSPPPILRALEKKMESQVSPSLPSSVLPKAKGFVRAVADPQINALHCSLLRKERKVTQTIAERRQKLGDRALAHGPESLSIREKKELLYDPGILRHLHLKVWEINDKARAEQWGIPQ